MRCRVRIVSRLLFVLLAGWLGAVGSGRCADAGAADASREAPPGFSGITKPFREATLSATVPGTVLRILFREGDRVKVGQTLIELDRRQEELEVARRKLVMENLAEVTAAAVKVAATKAEYESTRRVHEATKSISKDELDKKESEYKIAEAELAQLRTAEDREKIEYEMAQEQLRRRFVVAPMNGIVTEVKIEEGENCDPRQPLVRLVDAGKVYFVAHIEEDAARGFQVGQAVDIETPADPQPVLCRGEVCYVAPVVDPASGLQEIKAVFDNPGERVRPGVAGTLRLQKRAP